MTTKYFQDQGLNQAFNQAIQDEEESVLQFLSKLRKDDTLNFALKLATLSRDHNLINYFLFYGADDFNGALCMSVGNFKLIQYFVNSGANELDSPLKISAGQGNLNEVKFLIKKGATDFDSALHNAVESGHLDVVKFLVKNGASDLKYAQELAEFHEYLDIVKYLKEKINNFSSDLT